MILFQVTFTNSLLSPLITFCQNQFFISGLSGDDIIKNRVLEALYRRIMRAEKEKKCFRVIIVIPLLPGFQVIFLLNITSFFSKSFVVLPLHASVASGWH